MKNIKSFAFMNSLNCSLCRSDIDNGWLGGIIAKEFSTSNSLRGEEFFSPFFISGRVSLLAFLCRSKNRLKLYVRDGSFFRGAFLQRSNEVTPTFCSSSFLFWKITFEYSIKIAFTSFAPSPPRKAIIYLKICA